MTRVKICGVTTVGDAAVSVAAGAWAIGLNFWKGSSRAVDIAAAGRIARALAGAVPLVGVFVDAPRAEIEGVVRAVPLDMIQLHGAEAAADCRGWNLPVIKALRLRDRSTWDMARTFPADFVLADAYVAGTPGGTGTVVSTDLIGDGMRDRLILAGGLDPDNVAEGIRKVAPFAVDVASGVESAPGRKDPEKVKRFIANAHSA